MLHDLGSEVVFWFVAFPDLQERGLPIARRAPWESGKLHVVALGVELTVLTEEQYDLLVLHAPGERHGFRPTSTCGSQPVHQHRALPLPGVPCFQLYPPFQIGCVTGVCLTGLWSVRGWTLMCCSETRWFCHCGASGSEGHREVLVWVQNRRQQGQSGRHDNIDDSYAPVTRGLD